MSRSRHESRRWTIAIQLIRDYYEAMTHGKGDGQPCCPKFDPTPWDGKTHEWKDKPFTLESIPQFLHMPFPPMFARTVSRMWKQAQEAGAAPEIENFLLMAYDPSPWKSELYLAVTKEVPGAKNVALSGAFFTKVFDGPYNAVPNGIKEMEIPRSPPRARLPRSTTSISPRVPSAPRPTGTTMQWRWLRSNRGLAAGSLSAPPEPHSWAIRERKGWGTPSNSRQHSAAPSRAIPRSRRESTKL